MTPGARLSACIDICRQIDEGTTAADRIIDAYFKRRRYAGSKDRRSVMDQVYRIIRSQARLDWWIERSGSDLETEARTRALADLALSEKLQPAGLQELFSGARHCPEKLSDSEMTLASALAGRPITHHTEMPGNVTNEYPVWLEPSLKRSFGDALDGEMAALNAPAPLDVRVNMLKTTFEQAHNILKQEHVDAAPTELSPLALRVAGNVHLGGNSAFKQGYIEVQDEGSQLIALLSDAQPGMHVIDFCAGAGGKTLALAASMARGKDMEGSLVACDVFSQRLDRMKSRLTRAGAKGVRLKVLSGEADPWVVDNAEIADRVLLDVPCTGTGTWRREPDAKWRLHPADMERSVETQRRILASAQTLVKPSGRLIYATCSILPEENEQQIEWFLSEHPEFHVVDATEVWNATIGGTCPVAGPWLRLSPATTQTDGFFCAILERSAAQ